MDPREFRTQIEQDAAGYLASVLGSEAGARAAARVGMAFAAAARTARRPEALYACSRASVMSCVAMCALTNLMPGGPSPAVWLVPKKGELNWWLGHRGIATLALRDGYALRAMPVHRDDTLRVEFGEVVQHEADPDAWPDRLSDLRGCYVSILRLSDGLSLGRPWLPMEAIDKRRKAALTQDVWSSWPIEMAQKTAIKWAMSRGYIPVESMEMQLALEADLSEVMTTSATAALTDAPERPTLRAIIDAHSDETPDLSEEIRQYEDSRVPASPSERIDSATAPVREEVGSPSPTPPGEEPSPKRDTRRADTAAECAQLEACAREIPAMRGMGSEIREALGLPATGAPSGRWSLDALTRYRDSLADEIGRATPPAGEQDREALIRLIKEDEGLLDDDHIVELRESSGVPVGDVDVYADTTDRLQAYHERVKLALGL